LFEFQVALKYLIPRKRSLSTALISLMSVFVISLVVWLVLVFLSVTTGIEKNWLTKLTTLHAPIRISPTDRYYSSYYYKVDLLSAASNYTLKTIGEKAESALSDPYSATVDVELPDYWPKNSGIDPVKLAYKELSELRNDFPSLTFQDYEIAGALLRLNIQKAGNGAPSQLSQMSYLLSTPEKNPHFQSLILESIPLEGPEIPILLPKNYRDSGVVIGNTGALIYASSTTASSQEQRIPVRVSGFYDPGLLSMGNKCIIVPREITRTIHAASQTFAPDGSPTNGIFVWFQDLKEADVIKKAIVDRFSQSGIASYWNVETYREFEFAKDLMQQFQSDRTLLLLIAAIILIVACSNIISLLVLLVNDKRKEIAILQSMGASSKSIAAIFGLCGVTMGALSSLLGTALAVFTLHHLDALVAFLSAVQGRAAFNPAFFGQKLPNELSYEALLFVLIATPILTLTAGLIPALRASRIHPSSTLRAE
jgi:lipoprotein-releasing system permease protein